MKVYRLFSALALTAMGAISMAQGGPPEDGQGGPPPPRRMQGPGGPGRGPGGGPGMRRMGGEPLVMRPDVQKELKLSGEQLEKIRELMPRPRMRGPEGGPGEGGPGGERRMGPPPAERRGEDGPRGEGVRGERRPGMEGGPGAGPGRRMGGGPQGADRMDEQLSKILSNGQMKRLKELRLQRQGAMALMQREIADQVGLSDDDRYRLRGMIQEDLETMHERQPDRDGPPDPTLMRAHHEKLSNKILDSLSSKQRAKWNSMTGKTFKFDETWHPQPPRDGPQGGMKRRGGGDDGPPPPPDFEGGGLEASLVMEAIHDLSC